MKQMIGRRIVENEPSGAIKVVVRGRWFWQRDEFCSEGNVDVRVVDGVLKVDVGNKITSYSSSYWRTVSCEKNVVSRSRI